MTKTVCSEFYGWLACCRAGGECFYNLGMLVEGEFRVHIIIVTFCVNKQRQKNSQWITFFNLNIIQFLVVYTLYVSAVYCMLNKEQTTET